MLLRLLPGAHLLRRRDERWQVGLDPTQRVLLPRGSGPPSATTGALPPGTVLRAALPAPGACAEPVRRTLAALARETGDAFPDVLRRRDAQLVRVETFGPTAAAAVGEELLDVCERSGLRTARPQLTSSAAPRGSSTRGRGPVAVVVAVIGIGEPPREALDRHVREETPHLLVRLTEGRALVGPLVVPGRTPCLRCIDAHLTDGDPSWPLLVEQYVRAVATDRPDGVPEPVDAALASLAVAWAARDLATWTEGGTPTTLASTIEAAPRLERVETRSWSPHSRCGCSWR